MPSKDDFDGSYDALGCLGCSKYFMWALAYKEVQKDANHNPTYVQSDITRWKAPSANKLKVNLDSSFIEDDLKGSVGVMVKDH